MAAGLKQAEESNARLTAQVEATGKELGEVRAQAAAAQEALEAEKRAR